MPLDTLLTTVAHLWPDAEVSVGKRKSRPDQRTFLVVPRAAQPRLLVPALPRGAAAGSLRRFSSALRPADAASRMAVSLLLQSGGSAVLRDRVTVSGHGDSIEDQLGRVLGEPVVCSLGIGSDRGNRKAVLQVFDGRGRSIAFAKVAESEYVERLLEAEHDHLVQLAGHRLPPYLRVPEVIWFGRWRGLRVLVLTDLRPSVFSTVRPNDVPAPRQVMREFATSFGLDPAPLTGTALWSDAFEILRGLSDPKTAAVFGAALEAVERHAGTDEHPVGVWHGDWTPWNMGRRGRQLVLWDWERFRVGVPLGLDPVHYAVHAWCRKRGFRVASVLAGLESAGEPVSIEAAGGSIEAAAYLVAITGRYLEAAEHEGGASARESARVMLEVLRTWTRV